MKKINALKSNKILRKIFSITTLIMMLMSFVTVTYADDDPYKAANEWFKNVDTTNLVYLDTNVLGQIAKYVEIIGTGVIAIATVVLGIRYIIGSATQKADVKDNMITLFVACLFFFGWSNIRGIFIKGVTFSGVGVSHIDGNSSVVGLQAGTLEGAFGQILGIVTFIGKIIAVIATVYIGIKFVFSGAEGKSQLKEKGIMYVIGIILTFATLNVLSFVSDAVMGL